MLLVTGRARSALPRIVAMPEIRIRHGRPTDLEAALAADERRDDPSREAEIARALNEGACWLAEREGRTVGLVIFDHRFFGRGFIWLVTVSPDQRRTGVASALIGHIESSCRSDTLFSSTNQSNVPSQRLFEHLGFVRSGIVEHLDEGDAELFYMKRLRGRAGD